MATVHVAPAGDLIEHRIDDDSDCVCGPRVEPTTTDNDGRIDWVVIHHSLDGREHKE